MAHNDVRPAIASRGPFLHELFQLAQVLVHANRIIDLIQLFLLLHLLLVLLLSLYEFLQLRLQVDCVLWVHRAQSLLGVQALRR